MTTRPGADPTVLFVCEHGAAKSVLAAELLQRKLDELDLPIQIHAAGIDPSDAIADSVVGLIPERAWELRTRRPRRVTQQDIETASITITFNLATAALPTAPAAVLAWDDVPPLSDDPVAARAAIERHVEALVERLRA
jgi:protein-tyrosine-phosphatase